MSTLREAAQQALEALAIGQDAAHEVAQTYHEAMAGYRPARHIAVDDDVRKIEDAITALRAALAEPVLAPAPGYCKHCKQYTIEEPLPAEPVEPVASLMTHLQSGDMEVAWNDDGFDRELWHEAPLYTATPKRKPLTEEEIWRIYKNLWMFRPAEEPRLAGDVLKFARAIELEHGIT